MPRTTQQGCHEDSLLFGVRKMNQKLFAIASMGLASACGTKDKKDDKASAPTSTSVKCFGVNSCKTQGECAVSTARITAAQAKFTDKFTGAKEHECKGQGECSAASKQLNWVSLAESDCKTKGGFAFDGDSATIKTL